MEVPSAHSGGLAVLYHTNKHFSVEELQLYGTNVVSFQMVSGDQWWHIVWGYLVSDNTPTIEVVVAARGPGRSCFC